MHSPTAEMKFFVLTATSEPTLDLAIAIPTFTLTPSPTSTPDTQLPTVTPKVGIPTLPRTTATVPSLPMIEPRTRIAYVSSADGNREVYLADWGTSGAGQKYRLTENPTEDTLPSLSPDGWTVAFVSDLSGNRDIYLADLSPECATTSPMILLRTATRRGHLMDLKSLSNRIGMEITRFTSST